MKVLVTGSHGFIARHLIKKLLKDGHEVVGLDNYANSEPDVAWESTFEFYQEDITRLSAGHGLFHNVECVFHLAAVARVQPSFIDPKKYYDTNVVGTLNLLEACKQWSIKKFIFSSSSSVYGTQSTSLRNQRGSKEVDQLQPESPYAMSKVHGEELTHFYKRLYGIDCVILRYFNVYGDDQPTSGQYPQMLPYFIDLYKKGQPFSIYGSGNQRRDFTYVADVVDANIQSMYSNNLILSRYYSTIYNIGSGVNYSVNEICDIIDLEHPRIYLSPRKEPVVTLADNSNAKIYLAWSPTMSVEQWIKNQKL